MPAAYTPSGTEHTTLAHKLTRLGATLETDPHFAHTQCEWCGDVDALTEFRIWRRPAPATAIPDGPVDVCVSCFAAAIHAACDERGPSDDADILVEYPGTTN